VNLCDANVWLALALSRHVHHGTTRRWFESVAEPRTILFCRATQQTLLRLLTNSSVLAPYGNPPLTNAEAWKAYEAFAADERVALLIDEPPQLESRWKQLATRDVASPKLWMDAYLAAFAIAGRLRLVTTDIAFRQFGSLDHLLLK
jgi:toxin-antitoxin system PIN domain toxin